MVEVKIVAPYSVLVGDKKYAINLNVYRNLHYHVNNKIKVIYKNLVKEQLENIKFDGKVSIKYQVFKPSRRKLDKMNVVSITSKYLMDALTSCGCWEDDNDDVIKDEHILPTEVDRNFPRIEVYISSVEI